jgi:hypothetical protein
MLSTLQRMNRGDLTAHGFRSSFRDWCAERSSFPAEVAEMALAHTVSHRVEAAYRRSDLFEKRRQLSEAWEKSVLRRGQWTQTWSRSAARRYSGASTPQLVRAYEFPAILCVQRG